MALPSTGCPRPASSSRCCRSPRARLIRKDFYLVSPELADVLSAIISRLRGPGGAVRPAVPPKTTAKPAPAKQRGRLPLLFQRSIGSENRAFTPSAIRKLLINALAATGLTDAAGDPLMFSPHDFRRILSA